MGNKISISNHTWFLSILLGTLILLVISQRELFAQSPNCDKTQQCNINTMLYTWNFNIVWCHHVSKGCTSTEKQLDMELQTLVIIVASVSKFCVGCHKNVFSCGAHYSKNLAYEQLRDVQDFKHNQLRYLVEKSWG